MTRAVPLYRLATARSGDKGDTSNIAVIVRDPAHWPAVKAQVTPDRLRATWPGVFRGPGRAYALDHLCALNLVMERALDGGVNASLNLDAHGKALSFLVLDLTIDLPEEGGP